MKHQGNKLPFKKVTPPFSPQLNARKKHLERVEMLIKELNCNLIMANSLKRLALLQK